MKIEPEPLNKNNLTQAYLREILDYNSETGIFTWRVKIGNIKIGQLAGFTHNKIPYHQIKVRQKLYLAHRLAWLWVYGEFPNGYLDHIDMNRSNNRIDNLRIATNSQNQGNIKLWKTNTSGYRGVHWCRKTGKWRAGIRINSHLHCLGSFNTREEAAEAYNKAAFEVWGEFARLNIV